MAAFLQAVPERLGLGPLTALVAVASRPGLSVNDLAASLGVPQQTASRHVATLLGRSGKSAPLIEQRISVEDPRRRALVVTAAGREILDSLATAGWGAPAALPVTVERSSST